MRAAPHRPPTCCGPHGHWLVVSLMTRCRSKTLRASCRCTCAPCAKRRETDACPSRSTRDAALARSCHARPAPRARRSSACIIVRPHAGHLGRLCQRPFLRCRITTMRNWSAFGVDSGSRSRNSPPRSARPVRRWCINGRRGTEAVARVLAEGPSARGRPVTRILVDRSTVGRGSCKHGPTRRPTVLTGSNRCIRQRVFDQSTEERLMEPVRNRRRFQRAGQLRLVRLEHDVDGGKCQRARIALHGLKAAQRFVQVHVTSADAILRPKCR